MTDSCLDAETLAAWVDGGLTATELARAQAHAAGCVRCQAMIGTFARITEAAPTAVKVEAASRRWFAWVAPLAAAAAAVTIWLAIPTSHLDTSAPTTAQISAPAEPAGAAPAAPAPQSETKALAEQPQAKAPESLSDAKASPPPPAATPARADTEPQLERAKESRSDAAAQAPAALDKVTQGTAIGAVPETVTVTGAPPAMPAAPAPAGQGGAARANASAGVRSAFRQEAVVNILSPDPMIRWRLAGANVERSIDRGASWELTRTGISTPLTAGAASSATTVWVVGEAGVVLLSTDGRTWRRVASPQITNLSAVRARDASSASVTTADGRLFSTSDAGATWVQGPLQGF